MDHSDFSHHGLGFAIHAVGFDNAQVRGAGNLFPHAVPSVPDHFIRQHYILETGPGVRWNRPIGGRNRPKLRSEGSFRRKSSGGDNARGFETIGKTPADPDSPPFGPRTPPVGDGPTTTLWP